MKLKRLSASFLACSLFVLNLPCFTLPVAAEEPESTGDASVTFDDMKSEHGITGAAADYKDWHVDYVPEPELDLNSATKWSGAESHDWLDSGSGTQDSPYVISSPDDILGYYRAVTHVDTSKNPALGYSYLEDAVAIDDSNIGIPNGSIDGYVIKEDDNTQASLSNVYRVTGTNVCNVDNTFTLLEPIDFTYEECHYTIGEEDHTYYVISSIPLHFRWNNVEYTYDLVNGGLLGVARSLSSSIASYTSYDFYWSYTASAYESVTYSWRNGGKPIPYVAKTSKTHYRDQIEFDSCNEPNLATSIDQITDVYFKDNRRIRGNSYCLGVTTWSIKYTPGDDTVSLIETVSDVYNVKEYPNRTGSSRYVYTLADYNGYANGKRSITIAKLPVVDFGVSYTYGPYTLESLDGTDTKTLSYDEILDGNYLYSDTSSIVTIAEESFEAYDKSSGIDSTISVSMNKWNTSDAKTLSYGTGGDARRQLNGYNLYMNSNRSYPYFDISPDTDYQYYWRNKGTSEPWAYDYGTHISLKELGFTGYMRGCLGGVHFTKVSNGVYTISGKYVLYNRTDTSDDADDSINSAQRGTHAIEYPFEVTENLGYDYLGPYSYNSNYSYYNVVRQPNGNLVLTLNLLLGYSTSGSYRRTVTIQLGNFSLENYTLEELIEKGYCDKPEWWDTRDTELEYVGRSAESVNSRNAKVAACRLYRDSDYWNSVNLHGAERGIYFKLDSDINLGLSDADIESPLAATAFLISNDSKRDAFAGCIRNFINGNNIDLNGHVLITGNVDEQYDNGYYVTTRTGHMLNELGGFRIYNGTVNITQSVYWKGTISNCNVIGEFVCGGALENCNVWNKQSNYDSIVTDQNGNGGTHYTDCKIYAVASSNTMSHVLYGVPYGSTLDSSTLYFDYDKDTTSSVNLYPACNAEVLNSVIYAHYEGTHPVYAYRPTNIINSTVTHDFPNSVGGYEFESYNYNSSASVENSCIRVLAVTPQYLFSNAALCANNSKFYIERSRFNAGNNAIYYFGGSNDITNCVFEDRLRADVTIADILRNNPANNYYSYIYTSYNGRTHIDNCIFDLDCYYAYQNDSQYSTRYGVLRSTVVPVTNSAFHIGYFLGGCTIFGESTPAINCVSLVDHVYDGFFASRNIVVTDTNDITFKAPEVAKIPKSSQANGIFSCTSSGNYAIACDAIFRDVRGYVGMLRAPTFNSRISVEFGKDAYIKTLEEKEYPSTNTMRPSFGTEWYIHFADDASGSFNNLFLGTMFKNTVVVDEMPETIKLMGSLFCEEDYFESCVGWLYTIMNSTNIDLSEYLSYMGDTDRESAAGELAAIFYGNTVIAPRLNIATKLNSFCLVDSEYIDDYTSSSSYNNLGSTSYTADWGTEPCYIDNNIVVNLYCYSDFDYIGAFRIHDQETLPVLNNNISLNIFSEQGNLVNIPVYGIVSTSHYPPYYGGSYYRDQRGLISTPMINNFVFRSNTLSPKSALLGLADCYVYYTPYMSFLLRNCYLALPNASPADGYTPGLVSRNTCGPTYVSDTSTTNTNWYPTRDDFCLSSADYYDTSVINARLSLLYYSAMLSRESADNPIAALHANLIDTYFSTRMNFANCYVQAGTSGIARVDIAGEPSYNWSREQLDAYMQDLRDQLGANLDDYMTVFLNWSKLNIDVNEAEFKLKYYIRDTYNITEAGINDKLAAIETAKQALLDYEPTMQAAYETMHTKYEAFREAHVITDFAEPLYEESNVGISEISEDADYSGELAYTLDLGDDLYTRRTSWTVIEEDTWLLNSFTGAKIAKLPQITWLSASYIHPRMLTANANFGAVYKTEVKPAERGYVDIKGLNNTHTNAGNIYTKAGQYLINDVVPESDDVILCYAMQKLGEAVDVRIPSTAAPQRSMLRAAPRATNTNKASGLVPLGTKDVTEEDYTIAGYRQAGVNTIITPVFKTKRYVTVDIENSEHGTLVPSMSLSAEGEELRVGYAVDDGYIVQDIKMNYTLGGTDYSVPLTRETFFMPDADVELTGTCVPFEGGITQFTLMGEDGIIDQIAHTIEVSIPNSTYVTTALPIIEYYGNYITPSVDSRVDFSNAESIPVNYTVTYGDANDRTVTYAVTVHLSGYTQRIYDFILAGRHAEIDQANKKITVVVPSGTELRSIAPDDISYSAELITPAVETVRDFSVPQVYTLNTTGMTAVSYTVYAQEAAPDDAYLTKFVVSGISGDIDNDTHTVTLQVPELFDATDIKPSLISYVGKSITPTKLQRTDLETALYTVTAQSGVSNTYDIVLNRLSDNVARIDKFTLAGYTGTIDNVEKTITVTVPKSVNVQGITPDELLYTGKSIYPKVTLVQDFTTPVTYTVVAGNNTEVPYTVIVNRVDDPVIRNSEALLLEYSVLGVDGVIDQNAKTVTLTFPNTVDVSHAIPSKFVISDGATSNPDATVYHNYVTDRITYTVTSEDNSVKNTYTVKVIIPPRNTPPGNTPPLALDTTAIIKRFSIDGIDGTIDQENGIINVLLPSDYTPADIVDKVPNIWWDGKTIKPDDNESQNFNQKITYVVTAENPSVQKSYDVYVTIAQKEERPRYNIILENSPHGDIYSSVPSAYEGEPVQIWVVPELGYTAKSFVVDGVEKLPETHVSFSMPAHDVVAHVDFEEIPKEDSWYKIIIDTNEHGNTISTHTRAKAGTAVTVTAIPDEGYELYYFTVDGTVIDSNSSTFEMPDHDVTVITRYKKLDEKLYKIILEDSPHGDIDSSVPEAPEGAKVKIWVAPDPGYAPDSFIVDGTDELPRVEVTVIMPPRDIYASVTFKEIPNEPEDKPYKIILEDDPRGKIESSVPEAYEGEDVVITITPYDGYRPTQFLVDGDDKLPEYSYTFKMPPRDVTASVTFQEIPKEDPWYYILVQDTEHGAILSTHTKAKAGTLVSISIVPESGYKPDVFIADGEDRLPDYTYTFLMPEHDVTASATFSEIEKPKDDDGFVATGVTLGFGIPIVSLGVIFITRKRRK